MQCHMAHTRTMLYADTRATNPVTAVEEDADHKKTGIFTEVAVVEPTVILHITVGHIECVPILAKISGTQRMATRRMQYGVMICWEVRETTPDSLG